MISSGRIIEVYVYGIIRKIDIFVSWVEKFNVFVVVGFFYVF